MTSNYALRYRFFFRSYYRHVIFPKLPLRMILYLILTVLSSWFVWVVLPDEMKVIESPLHTFAVVVYLIVFLSGECTLRIHLLEGGRPKSFLSEFALNLIYIVIVPPFMYLFFSSTAYVEGWIPDDSGLFSHYWTFNIMAGGAMVVFAWLLMWYMSRRYFPFTQKEASFIHREPEHLVVAKSMVKKFMKWYKRDEFDEVLFDAQHAGEFSEEAYHKYRMDVACRYLDTPPFQLKDPDNELPMDVVFILDTPDEPDYFLEECAETIQHDELVIRKSWSESHNKACFYISYLDRQLITPIETGYRRVNALIIKVAELLAPEYGIRQCRLVKRDGIPYFMSLPNAEWRQLQDRYGAAKMNRYFTTVDANYTGLSYYASWLYKIESFIRLPANQLGSTG